MNTASSGSGEDGTRRSPPGRLVFHSGLVSLDDPRITPLREGFDELVERLLRPTAGSFAPGETGRSPK